MRKLFAIFALILCMGEVWAQSPQKMSYQAIVRNATNQLVASTTVGMKISMLQGSASGTAVYVETQNPKTNSNGLVSIEIGGGTVISGTFAVIDWANGPYFIKTETDPAGGTNYTITGVSQLLSVPYALYALSAGSLSSTSILLPAVAAVQAASDILSYSATINGTVNGKGLSTTVSFEWGLTTAYGNTVTATPSPVTGANPVAVSTTITGLQSNTTYHYRIKTSNAVDISYSNDVSFITVLSAPQLTTTSISAITGISASSGGNITYDGGAAVTARGVCWSTSSNPTITDSKTSDATGTGIFTSTITGLLNGTTYYVRAYATNSVGTYYGNQISFPTLPTVTTTAISAITGISASSGGYATSSGGAPVTARGVCWSTSSNPTINNSKTSDATGTGAFTSAISGLASGTTYYVKAYVTSSSGTSYGNEVTFITLPSVTTTAISATTGISASSGGYVTSTGSAAVTARGICWSTSSNPTINDSKTSDASGTGAFTSAITGLLNGTTYYVRAYATNSVGTSYGTQISFTTFSIPTLTTAAFTNIKGNSAKSGGTVNGGGSITAQGLCWSTSATPTIANSVSTSFTDVMTGLSPNTTYYVRAYATNPAGTGYGNQISFNSGQIIGSTSGGGLVFYNDGTGHGLICASTDQSTGIQWYNGSFTSPGATSTAIGTGNANTNTIVAFQGSGTYAAKLCADLILNTYSDWYLPSKDELNLMYTNLKTQGLGGFATLNPYWSSSDCNGVGAYFQDFAYGYEFNMDIDYYNIHPYNVRAVRTF